MVILKEPIQTKNIGLPLFSFMLRHGLCFPPHSWYFQTNRCNNYPKAERD